MVNNGGGVAAYIRSLLEYVCCTAKQYNIHMPIRT